MLKERIKAIDPCIEEDDPGLNHAVVLLASAVFGNDPATLASQTGYPLEFIEHIVIRLKVSQIWIGNTVDFSDWFQEGSPARA